MGYLGTSLLVSPFYISRFVYLFVKRSLSIEISPNSACLLNCAGLVAGNHSLEPVPDNPGEGDTTGEINGEHREEILRRSRTECAVPGARHIHLQVNTLLL